jgi:tetratricopeptide (TPR) repeat protein
MTRIVAVALVVAAAAGGTGRAAFAPAEDPFAPRVLVMPFSIESTGGGTDAGQAGAWLGEAASTLLADELTLQGVSAFSREDRAAVFERLNVPMSPELTRATIIRIGDLIGATEVVFGTVEFGTALAIRARTVRLDTGQMLPETADRGALTELFPLIRRLSGRLAAQAGHRTSPATGGVPDMPLPALESYVKGLMALTPPVRQKFLEAAMAQAPRDSRVLTALWSVYSELGLPEKALGVASAVPSDSPHYQRARWQVSLSLIELRRVDGAVKELQALHAATGLAVVSNAIGIAELRRGAGPESAVRAAVFFERASKESPDTGDYLFNAGYAKALAGETGAASTWLRELVRRDAADGDAHLVLAIVLAAQGRRVEADRELDLARTLGTSVETLTAIPARMPENLERLPTSLLRGVPADALASAAQLDQLDTARFHLERGRAFIDARRDREAVAELRRAVYLAPYEHEPHLLLGDLYRRAGRHAEAIDELKVALWCRETADGRVTLGRAYLESGDRAAARAEFERALVLDPESAAARDWLARIGGGSARSRVLTSFPHS